MYMCKCSIIISMYVYRYLTRFHGDCQMNLNSVERIIEYCEVPSERYGEEDDKKGKPYDSKRVLKRGGLGLGIVKKRLNKRRSEKGELYSLLPHTGDEEDDDEEEEEGIGTEDDKGDEVEEGKEEEVSYTPITTAHSPLNPQIDDTSDELAIDLQALQTHTGRGSGDGAIEFRHVQLKYRISDPPVLR